jgi:hypothetical protein
MEPILGVNEVVEHDKSTALGSNPLDRKQILETKFRNLYLKVILVFLQL